MFGSALLALNFANEYAAYGGSLDLLELPSVDSMVERLGATGHERHPYATPDNVLRQTLHRAGVASAPYAVAERAWGWRPLSASTIAFGGAAIWGTAAACWALAALALIPRRFRAAAASLALMGFVWALAARHNTYDVAHTYEGLFFYGLPLALWLAALIGARRLLGARLGGAFAIGIAALAAALFTLSALQTAPLRVDADAERRAKDAMADMDAVRKIASGKGVAVYLDAKHWTHDFGARGFSIYYLAGSYHQGDGASASDYALSRYRDESLNLLTPGNRRLFLYESTGAVDLYRAERRRIESSPPDAESHFDLYLEEGGLAYLRAPCVRESDADDGAPFFLRLYPVGAGEPSEFSERRFEFSRYGVAFDDACMMSVDLPSDYPIAAVQTGQRAADGALIWQAAAAPPSSAETLAAYESAYQAVADGGEPAARSGGFDLHLTEDALIYLKQPCAEEDVRGRFWLSVHPADAADLPANRRRLGHESLNFDFISSLGAAFNGKCMATIRLPDYEIAKMETGQDAPGAGRVWEAAIVPPAVYERAYEKAYQTIADGTPAARSAFDLYLDADGGALSYLKQPCTEEDARGRFFLSVYPADAADLPEDRRETGHESLNFDFEPPTGAVFNGKCMATVQLPDYEIAKMETGQNADGGGRLWQAAVVPPSVYEGAYAAIASGEPSAQSGFDLYLDADGGSLSYLKQPCSHDDVRGRFFLSVHPADVADLPAERRELGHESLNFDFVPPIGAAFNGKCMATIQLPDYAIDRIETGQDSPDGGRLWSATVSVGD